MKVKQFSVEEIWEEYKKLEIKKRFQLTNDLFNRIKLSAKDKTQESRTLCCLETEGNN